MLRSRPLPVHTGKVNILAKLRPKYPFLTHFEVISGPLFEASVQLWASGAQMYGLSHWNLRVLPDSPGPLTNGSQKQVHFWVPFWVTFGPFLGPFWGQKRLFLVTFRPKLVRLFVKTSHIVC